MEKLGDLITIIIPIFNRADYAIETVKSIKNQIFHNYEVLLIDDNSNLKEFKKLEYFLNNLNDRRFVLIRKPDNLEKGANSSRKFGFESANGNLIKWFDSDDLMKPDFLSKQYSYLKKYNLDGVLAECEVYDSSFNELIKRGWRDKSFSDNVLRDYLDGRLAWQTGSGLWRKVAIEKNSPFSQELNNGQEYVFHFQMITSNINIGVITDPSFRIRSHSNSISRQKSLDYRYNQFKSRVIILNRLIETRNKGKKATIIYMLNLMRRFGARNYLKFIKIFINNFQIGHKRSNSLANFIKLD